MGITGVSSGRSRVGRLTALAVAAVVAVLTLLSSTSPTIASSQTGQLRLVSQTPYVAADGELAIRLSWSGALDPQLRLSATIFAPISDEDATSAPPEEPLNRFPAADRPLPLTSVPRSPDGLLNFAIPIRSFTAGDNRIWLKDPGVYPVVVEVRGADGPVASLRTHLIRLPTETAEIPLLPAALVLNVSSADGLELPEAIGLLQRHPSLPITVLLEDGVLAQLTSDAELAADFRAALGTRTLTAIPALNLDPSALAEIDQGQLYGAALDETSTRFARVGLAGDPTMLPLDTSLTAAGSALLEQLGIDVVIDLTAPAGSGGSIAADGAGPRVVRIDEERTSQLRGGARSVERAHLLLATLAIRGETDRSPVVIGGPELRSVDIDALEVVLNAVAQPGLIEAINVQTAAASGPTVPLRRPERPDQDLRPVADDIASILDRLATYDDFHVNGPPAPVQIEQSLLSALSRDRNPADRNRALAIVNAELDGALGVVELPAGQSFTLATRTSPIPLSITNNSDGERVVMLRFRSDRIDVEEEGELITIQPGTSSVDINVEALSLGVSPLEVVLTTPDEEQELASTRFQIRSTAIPGLGFLLSGAALVFLIVWWIRSITRARSQRHQPTDVAGPDESDDRAATGNGHRTNGTAHTNGAGDDAVDVRSGPKL